MDILREAYNCFTGITSERWSRRMLYDQRYDQVIISWKFNAGYDSDATKENFKVREQPCQRLVLWRILTNVLHYTIKKGIKPMSGVLRYFMQWGSRDGRLHILQDSYAKRNMHLNGMGLYTQINNLSLWVEELQRHWKWLKQKI